MSEFVKAVSRNKNHIFYGTALFLFFLVMSNILESIHFKIMAIVVAVTVGIYILAIACNPRADIENNR